MVAIYQEDIAPIHTERKVWWTWKWS